MGKQCIEDTELVEMRNYKDLRKEKPISSFKDHFQQFAKNSTGKQL